MKQGTMELSIIPQDFSNLEKEWQSLLPHCDTNTVFTTPQWQRVWWEQFGTERELLLLNGYRDGRLIGIAPLMRKDHTISFVGDTQICDYLDFIVTRGEEESFYSALLAYLDKLSWRSLDLYAIPDYSRTIVTLLPLAKELGYSVAVGVEDVCPRVTLGKTWDDYLAGLNKKYRHELRRKLRRLKSSGTVNLYATPRDSLETDMVDFIRLHRMSREDKARFMDSEMEAFFLKEMASLAERDYLKLFFMELDGVRVSSAICFDYGDELGLYNSGFDPAYSTLSVGLLLKALCLKKAIESGKRRFDFLRGKERYKYELGGEDLPVHHCLITRGEETTHVAE
ncbi:MAG: GNAT family N-acetyltransferase [Chloroflexota bacterium]